MQYFDPSFISCALFCTPSKILWHVIMPIYSCTLIEIFGSPLCQLIMAHQPHSRIVCKCWSITSLPWSDMFRLTLTQTWVSSHSRPRWHSLCVCSTSPCHTNTSCRLPLKWPAAWPSPRSSSLGQHSRPWTGSWCRETSLRSWTAPWGRGTARAHPHTPWRGISPGEQQNNTQPVSTALLAPSQGQDGSGGGGSSILLGWSTVDEHRGQDSGLYRWLSSNNTVMVPFLIVQQPWPPWFRASTWMYLKSFGYFASPRPAHRLHFLP